MKKEYFNLLIIFLVLIFPILVFADGGMIIWPSEIYLDQSAQNAIVAWDGAEEIIILSVDIESSDDTTNLRIIPLPSDPSEIKEGSFESFEKLVEIMNEKIEAGNWKGGFGAGEGVEAPTAEGIEITFQQEIGAHGITVVKVNNLDSFLDWVEDFAEDNGFSQKQVSSEFREGIKNYLKKDIKYFVFDVIEAGQKKESVKPLIYRFDSDFLYYPLLISGISEIAESRAEINLFLITKKGVDLADFPYTYYSYSWLADYGGGYGIELTEEELGEISEELVDLFKGETEVTKAMIYKKLSDVENDLMIFPSYLWERSMALGRSGEEVRALQQVLINDGFWGAEVEATGYFGPITKNALSQFQEEYSGDILEPVGLENGTGVFDSQTKNYLKRISFSVEKEGPNFERNLKLGMQGDDVRALQEILIEEGVWERLDVVATGYFGQITKEAVIKYQEKYASEILEPLGLTKGTGFVGPSTRQHLEKK